MHTPGRAMRDEIIEDRCAGYEITIFTGESSMVYPIPPSGSVILGRADGCELRIDDASVSGRHAILHASPSLWIGDLGSENGTFVRERTGAGVTGELRRISGIGVEIRAGDWLAIGGAIAVVRRTAPRSRPRARRAGR